ncbi:MAG: radical SAM protein [Candidatus Aminicenantes bacterium]|jgi:radical SAM superfamily enzyme YgiQ (UPF0313 family)
MNNMGKNYRLQLNPKRPPIRDLDYIPFVDRSIVDYEKYNQYIGQSMVKDCMTLQATRGCPYKCAFCHKIWPKTHNVRSAENIFAEVQLYYNIGVRRFAFVDDIFNFNRKNSTRFYELIIKNRLDVQFFFPNGLRCDILTEDYIDLMIEAGTVNIAFALDTGSPRLQKLIGRNLNIDKFRENIEYVSRKYPSLILEFHSIHGFPTETESEALQTLNFIKSIKWIHFPYVHILKIFPNTNMEKLARESGISDEAIARSLDLTFDELPYDELESPLPFRKEFTYRYQAEFLHEYFLSKERLLYVLPQQMKIFTEGELVQKYNSFLPFEVKKLDDLLQHVGIILEQLGVEGCQDENTYFAPNLNEKIRNHFPEQQVDEDALRVFLLDLSLFFSKGREILYDVVEPPLGLMYIMSYLKQQKGSRVYGKIAKSRIDFDSYQELKNLLEEFKPHVIGIRTLTVFKKFFHEAVETIRQWGIDIPIVAGGPYATSEYETILKDPNVDIVVIGEGEITFCELINSMMENGGTLPGQAVLEEINGLAFKSAAQIEAISDQQQQLMVNKPTAETDVYVTASRHSITDFDSLPIPDRSLVDYTKYNKKIGMAMSKSSIALQASRGCPYKCAFCHKIWPKSHVTRSAENLFREVRLYYDIGVRKFSLFDDIFNLDIKNSSRFYELIIKNNMDVQIFFPNGVRGDIMTREYIDLMVEAGTITVALSLETASPRLQKLIRKNLNIERFRDNIEYFCKMHPHVIVELQTMHGFPTETKEEAMETLEFIKSLKWVHIPYINVLKIYPNTEMEKIAIANGIPKEAILSSQDLAFHELPDTLPFDKNFTLMYQSDFLNNYFLLKERLLFVLPYQMKLFTEDEILQKYNIYFPVHIETFDELLKLVNIKREELSVKQCADNCSNIIPGLNRKFREVFPKKEPAKDALRILLLDLSQLFSQESVRINIYWEPPLGLLYLMTYLNREYGSKVQGKICKSGIDFDNFTRLKAIVDEFQPDLIGIRTLTLFKKFFHETVANLREWQRDIPIITGGPYATSDYREILQDPNVDLVVLGEGEITFSELIGKFMENNGKMPDEVVLKEIAGIAYVPGKVLTGAQEAIPKLSKEKETEILQQLSRNLEDEF